MPTPCPNCIRFHYGECNNEIKQCFECQGFGHLERYCPNRRVHIQHIPGQPLAGTRSWCEMHGLDSDPELKKRILNALKMNPGSALFINNVCIYTGSEKHFDGRNLPSRGRDLEDRMVRDRGRTRSPRRPIRLSRSPPVPRYRDKSPRRDDFYRGPSDLFGPYRYEARYRSRSPIRYRRRTPSPYGFPSYAPGREPVYRPRSPCYARDSNAVIYEARGWGAENRAPLRAVQPVRFSMPPPELKKQVAVALNGRSALVTPHGLSIKAANSDISGVLQTRDTNARHVNGAKEPQLQSKPIKGSQPQSQAAAFNAFKESQLLSQKIKTSDSRRSSPRQFSEGVDYGHVEDPHFVLGITRGAGRHEQASPTLYPKFPVEIGAAC
ncbi:unnamed protein product [Diplocarpon coronariae]|nr:hypothetical protein JHW43_009563 [Diplocarpon mali]